MPTHREQLTAPPSWWLGAVGHGVVWGWITLVVGSTPVALAVGAAVALIGCAAVQRYGAVVVSAGPDGLTAGRAHLDAAAVGRAEALDAAAWRERLGPRAHGRAWLLTRPYLDRGVMVEVVDPADSTPCWLVSSRDPHALVRALTPGTDARPDGGTHGGEEEAEDV